MIGFKNELRETFSTFGEMVSRCRERSRKTQNVELDFDADGVGVDGGGLLFSKNPRHTLHGNLTRKTLTDLARRLRIPSQYVLSIDDAFFASEVINQRIAEKGSSLEKASMRVESVGESLDEKRIIGLTGGATYKWFTPEQFATRVESLVQPFSDELTFLSGTIEGGSTRALFKSASHDLSTLEVGRAVDFGVSVFNSCDGHRSMTVFPYANIVGTGFRIAHVSGKRLRVIHRGENFDRRVAEVFAAAVDAIDEFKQLFVALEAKGPLTEKETDLIKNYVDTVVGLKKLAKNFFSTGATCLDAIADFCAVLGGKKPLEKGENALDAAIDNDIAVGAFFDFLTRMRREDVIQAVVA